MDIRIDHSERLRTLSDEYRREYGFGIPWNIPNYSEARHGEWTVSVRPSYISSSYLAKNIVERPHTVLTNENEVWMSTGLLELESHAWHLYCAKGNIVVAGLGLGMYAHAASMKPDVQRIVVIERDPDVITLMKQSSDFLNWSNREKVVIIEGDVLSATTAAKVTAALGGNNPDYLYSDIWPIFPAPEAPGQTKSMIDLYSPLMAGWWGQEVEFGIWLEQGSRHADLDALQSFFAYHDIDAPPLTEGYLAFCLDAASVQLGEEFTERFGGFEVTKCDFKA